MNISRRAFIGSSLMGAAGCAVLKGGMPRHISDYDGVQLGVITYSYRTMKLYPGCTLKHTLDSKLGTIELMSGDLEMDVGAPFSDKLPWKLTNDEKKAISEWRRTVDVAKFEDVRRKYNDAGVDIHIVKFGGIGGLSDWETDYCFKVAKAMGARAITREVSGAKDGFADFKKGAEQLKPYMDKYGINVAFHNHLQINYTTYDGPLLDWSDKFMINLDIGHFTAANDGDPLDMVRKYHDRIQSIHIKDRTTKAHGQKNLAFGQGDTPLAGLFALLKREGWDIPCDIELEYAIPQGSDAVKEVGVSNAYCRNLILG